MKRDEDLKSILRRIDGKGYKAYKAGKTKSNVWVSDEGEMFRKTVIKRHCKYLPKSGDKLYKAIEVSNYATGFDESLSHSLWAYVESKLESSTLDEPRKDTMRKELENFNYKWEADKMLEYLEQYQPKSLDEQFKSATE